MLVPHQQAAATEADIKQFLDFNRHNPLDDFSWKTANINSSKATHGWAVMYGSLFIWLFVYPCNPSCYIGRRQQMSRDISHQPVLKSHTIRGLHVHHAAATKIKGFWKVVKVFVPVQRSTPFLQSHVGGRAGETQPWASSNGAIRKKWTQTHMLLIITAE